MRFLKTKRDIFFLLAGLLVLILIASAILVLDSQKVLNRSSASISLDNSKIAVKFNITASDRSKQSQFASNLGVGDDWSDGFEVGLNSETINLIKSSIPSLVYLSFDGKDLKFSSQRIPLLTSALIGKDFDFATGSAKLHLKEEDSSNYSLVINNPEDLIKYATSSAQLYVSKELSPLFPILSKIDTIKLDSNGGNAQGEIILK